MIKKLSILLISFIVCNELSSMEAPGIVVTTQDGKYCKELSSDVLAHCTTVKALVDDNQGLSEYALPACVTGQDMQQLEAVLDDVIAKRKIFFEAMPFATLCSLAQTADYLDASAVYQPVVHACMQRCASAASIEREKVLEGEPYAKLSTKLQSRIALPVLLKHSGLYALFLRAQGKMVPEKLQPLCTFNCTQNSSCYMPDGRIACANGNRVQVCNPVTGTVQATLTGHTNTIARIVAAHARSLLASVGDTEVFVYDTQENKLKHKLDGHIGRVDDCAFDHTDQKMATVSFKDHTTRLWSLEDGSCIKSIPFASHVLATSHIWPTVGFSPQGHLVIGSDYKVKLYDQTMNVVYGEVSDFALFESFVINDQGKVAFTYANLPQIQEFDLTTGQVSTINTHLDPKIFMTGKLTPHSYNTDGTRLVTKHDGKIQVYDTSSKSKVQEFVVGAFTVSYVPGTDILVTYNKNALAFWDSISGRALQSFAIDTTRLSLCYDRPPVVRFDANNQNCLLQTGESTVSVFPCINATHVANLSIEKLTALLYAAQAMQEKKSSINHPNDAIKKAFAALPEDIKAEIQAGLVGNRS